MRIRFRLIALATLALAPALRAQDTTKATRDTVIPPAPVAPAPAAALPFDFSGVMYVNYQTGGSKAERSQNRFELERAYLTFRGAAGDHITWRITADVYQQRDSTRDQYYRGWALRAKYAYFQYDLVRDIDVSEWKMVVRGGMLHTPIIDYEETFWPRGITNSPTESNGFFSSADVGAATLVTLPNRMGELYAGTWNGGGYTTRETDRFKDFGARLTLTPLLMNHVGFFRTFAVTPWYYKGTRASDYFRGNGTVKPVGTGLAKDRYGVHVGVKDPRIVIGLQLAQRTDVIETANVAVDVVPASTDRTGSLRSLYTVVKPLTYFESLPSWPVNVVLRADDFKPDNNKAAHERRYVAGFGLDMNKKSQLWFDYQDVEPKNGSSAVDSKTYFAHVIINF
ncbi:MAG: hypothetical protein JWO05_3115 [Gemmatimonadetes bacterium]|nr:hypothetical protein [Gemmatimonadota bacterium]